MQKYKRPAEICLFFLQGRCRFGNRCVNSHMAIEVHLIRHGQSLFNYLVQQYTMRNILAFSQEAKTFQFDQKLIDCSITEEAHNQLKKLTYQSSYEDYQNTLRKGKGKKSNEVIKYDILFVSPLQRALQSADVLIKEGKIQAKKVVVLPRLTEVLSKICDFSNGIKEKAQRYNKFDFSLFTEEMNFDLQLGLEQASSLSHYHKNLLKKKPYLQIWQDILISNPKNNKPNMTQTNGKRYLELLFKVFPVPLQSSAACFARTEQLIKQVRGICEYHDARKIGVVGHNRILKYICGRWSKGRADSFGNGQLRVTWI